MSKRTMQVTIGSIDRKPDVIRTHAGDTVAICCKGGDIEIAVTSDGRVRVRSWTKLLIRPVAANVIDVEEDR